MRKDQKEKRILAKLTLAMKMTILMMTMKQKVARILVILPRNNPELPQNIMTGVKKMKEKK